MIILLLIVILIIVIVNRRLSKREKSNYHPTNDQPEDNPIVENIQKLNDEILEELEKPEPDYEKMQVLRARINELKNLLQQSPPSQENTDLPTTTTMNVNGLSIALYAGSILILGGVGGLVASGAREVGLTFLILMATVFYVGGMLLRKNETLKMASYVFVGTGMMILPFIGFLIYDLTKMEPGFLWLVMSLVGVPVYFAAAYVMNSKVFTYFAILGLVSLSCSLASAMGLALTWYFVLVMVMGVILDIIVITSKNKNFGAMYEPIRQAGEWLPLATFVASLFASYYLTEADHVITLGIISLQLIVDYLHSPTLVRENLLRLALPAWGILVAHLLEPTVKTTGIALAGAALAQVILVFYHAARNWDHDSSREALEAGWTIAAMVCFLIAGILIGATSEVAVWAWCSFAFVIDAIVAVLARYAFRADVWYIGLLLCGVALPITISYALEAPFSDAAIVVVVTYLLEMAGFEALYWKNTGKDGDVLACLSIGTLGLATIGAGWAILPVTVAFVSVAAALGLRGHRSKQEGMKEFAIYLAALGIYYLLPYINWKYKLGIEGSVTTVIFGHFVLVTTILTSLLRERKQAKHVRLVVGTAIALFCVGVTAIGDTDWAMYLFLVEGVAVLMAGAFIKDGAMRITGAIAIFLAVLWFSRNLSFVWPIVLGLGIIGTVVIILLRNDRKTPPKVSKSK